MAETPPSPRPPAGPGLRRNVWAWLWLWPATLVLALWLGDRRYDAMKSRLGQYRYLVASAQNLSLDYTARRAARGSWPPTSEIRKEIPLMSSAYDPRRKARIDVYRHGIELVFVLGDDGSLMYSIDESSDRPSR